jgi:predicted RNA polymerase sigma factor
MTTPAGWYPDPGGAAHLRYWDGQAWSENYAPYPQPRPGQPDSAEQIDNLLQVFVKAYDGAYKQTIASTGTPPILFDHARAIHRGIAEQCGADPEMQRNLLALMLARAIEQLPRRD